MPKQKKKIKHIRAIQLARWKKENLYEVKGMFYDAFMIAL